MFKKVVQVNVANLLIQVTGTYNPMVFRPYATSLTNDTIEQLSNLAIQSPSITASLIAPATASFLSPSATHTGLVHIPGNWTEQRCRFMLELHVKYADQTTSTVYMQGYTDFPGVSLQTGNIALDMMFFINSYSVINTVPMMTPVGVMNSYIPLDNAHLLTSHDNNQLVSMRPQDIFAGMQTSMMVGSDPVITDTRNMVSTTQSLKSNRSNSTPVAMTARVIDTYMKTRLGAEYGLGSQDIFTSSMNNSYEDRLDHNPVIRYLSGFTSSATAFSFAELCELDRSTVDRTVVSNAGSVMRAAHHTGMTSDWHGADRETVGANMLAFGITGLMVEMFITRLVVKSTNMETGRPLTVVIDAKSPAGGDLTSKLEVLKSRLEAEIISNLSFGNYETYSFEVRADIYGETWIKISLAGQPFIDYVLPTFADARFSPVLSNNINNYQHVVNDFEHVVSAVAENITGNQKPNSSFSSASLNLYTNI